MVYPTDFLLNLKRTVKLRSCFKFIPRQGLNMGGTYLLAMIILFSINLKQLLKSVSYFSDRNRSMYSEPFRAICVVAAKYQHIGTKQKKNRFAE